MGATVQSVTEIWVQSYSLLQNYVCNYTVCYRTMGRNIPSVTELGVQEYSMLWNYGCKSKKVLKNYCCIFKNVTEVRVRV